MQKVHGKLSRLRGLKLEVMKNCHNGENSVIENLHIFQRNSDSVSLFFDAIASLAPYHYCLSAFVEMIKTMSITSSKVI